MASRAIAPHVSECLAATEEILEVCRAGRMFVLAAGHAAGTLPVGAVRLPG